MTTKILHREISFCGECPYVLAARTFGFLCVHPSWIKPVQVPGEAIFKNCPLDDKPE